MAKESVAQEASSLSHGKEQHLQRNMLGPLLCWAVVFADIGTSVYYTPGILYQTVHSLAGFFVFLTMSVFVLLTLKYAEVTSRFPQGGGVVTVAAQAINPWVGALGGMFILVDYFLTAAISCLSGILYFSVVAPSLGPYALFIAIGMLVLLGLLNWVGISESARVSLIGAIIAFISDIAILISVFTHISFSEFLGVFGKMFSGNALTPTTILVGFAGSFLAFSGLESISQLSPVMKEPHKKVAGIALFLVVLTIGLTSPLLTMLSTILLPGAANDPNQNTQIISLLGGHYGGIVLQTEVAISASALLVFASNTAIIGAYHVFMALSRMEFLPSFVLKRNKLRGTPHFSIALATGIPIVILLAVWGNINTLGDMYAFGLLGAFTLTCLGLDIVRWRDWRDANKSARRTQGTSGGQPASNGYTVPTDDQGTLSAMTPEDLMKSNGHLPAQTDAEISQKKAHKAGEAALARETKSLWFKIDFFLGVLTTFLVALAWCTNLVSKPLATAFGGGVALLGMLVAYLNYMYHQKHGRVPVPVVVTRVDERIPDSVLAILVPGKHHNDAVIRAAIDHPGEDKAVVFLYLAESEVRQSVPQMMEIIDPYLDDEQAKEAFGRAESLALKAKVPTRRFLYLQSTPDIVAHAWQVIHPRDTVVAAENDQRVNDINPDRIRYEITSEGKVAHLLKRW